MKRAEIKCGPRPYWRLDSKGLPCPGDGDQRHMLESDRSDLSPQPIWALSTDNFDPVDRFDAWHMALSSFNDVWVSPESRRDFRAATSYWPIGQLTLVQSFATPVRLNRSYAQAARDQLEGEVVVVFATGESRTELEGCHYSLAADEVAFGNHRNGYDFNVTSLEGARWNELICSPAVRDRLSELGSGVPRSGSEQTPQSHLLGQFICSVAQRLPKLMIRDMPLIEQAALCLLAATYREPTSGPARLSEVARQTVDRTQALTFIERELFSARLTADRVCDVTGISRSSLYRLFETDNGVANYIRMRRLDALRSDLVDPSRRRQSVAQLAEARGFHNPSTLNRAFRRRFGCTPGEVRTGSAQPFTLPDASRIDCVMEYLRTQRRA